MEKLWLTARNTRFLLDLVISMERNCIQNRTRQKGLTRAHLVMSRGRIVSKKARASALKNGNLGVFKKLAMKNKGKKFVTMKRSMVKVE